MRNQTQQTRSSPVSIFFGTTSRFFLLANSQPKPSSISVTWTYNERSISLQRYFKRDDSCVELIDQKKQKIQEKEDKAIAQIKFLKKLDCSSKDLHESEVNRNELIQIRTACTINNRQKIDYLELKSVNLQQQREQKCELLTEEI